MKSTREFVYIVMEPIKKELLRCISQLKSWMDIFTKMMDELKIEGDEIHLHKIILSPVTNLLKGGSDELDKYQASIESDHTVDSFQDLTRELDKLSLHLINATACLWQKILFNEKIVIQMNNR